MHGMCNFEDGTRAARRLAKGAPNSSHTSPIAPTATCCSCLLWFFVLRFPHDENRAFIFATPASSSLVFVVSEPCVRSTRMRGILLRSATQAKWHGCQPICIVESLSAVRCLQRTSDCYEVNRVSVAPRRADAVGSLKQSAEGERRYGRDA